MLKKILCGLVCGAFLTMGGQAFSADCGPLAHKDKEGMCECHKGLNWNGTACVKMKRPVVRNCGSLAHKDKEGRCECNDGLNWNGTTCVPKDHPSLSGMKPS